jgi:hypothetical protein
VPDEKDPSGTLVAFEKAVSFHSLAVDHEREERAKASQAVFNDVWTSAKALFEDKDATIDNCPVCDSSFASSPHSSRDNVHVSLDTKLGDLAGYRKAQRDLIEAAVALDKAVLDLKTGLETATASLKGCRLRG